MPLVLTEEQVMLRDSARDFLAENGPVAQLRQLRDDHDASGYSKALWKRFAEMGFTGILVPEAHGGLGLGHVEAGVVMAEIGRNLTASPFLASSVVAVSAIGLAGSDAQKAAWLPALASGDRIATLAVDEHSKHRPAAIALKAKQDGAGYRLDGHKTYVIDGHVADALIVAARTAGGAGETAGINLFLVDAKAAGVAIERVITVDSHNAARIAFNNVIVPEDALLGAAGEGWATLRAALDAGRVAAAAELVGLADEAFDRTVSYLKERRQFGQVIGEFQGLQHRASMLYCELELSRAAVLKAQQALDADRASSKEATRAAVAVAKAKAGVAATLAVNEGVQMHGGMGMTDAFEMGFFMKRARALQELFGDANFHMDALATGRHY